LEKQRGCKFIESHGKPTPLLLVANKTDLESERIISTAKGKELAKKWQLPDDAFLEVSATDQDQIKVTVSLLSDSLNIPGDLLTFKMAFSVADVGGQRCPDSVRNYCAVSVGQNQVQIQNPDTRKPSRLKI